MSKRSRSLSGTEATPFVYGETNGRAWRQQGERIDLVRRTVRPRITVVRHAQGEVAFDLRRTALAVIDMQNDFCHPRGWFGAKGISVRPMRKPIPVLARVLPAWRAAGGTVIWLNWGVRADLANLPPSVRYKGKRQPQAIGYAEPVPGTGGRAVVPGEWGAQVVDELAIDPADLTVFKHRLSGFWDNELDSILRVRGIDTLVFAGVNTDRCVYGSLQDAAYLGYDCLLLADGCGTPSPAYVTRAIHFLVQQLHGFVIDSDALLDGLPAEGARRPAPKASFSSKEQA
ncbi:cysteine hydrolase [Verticiella sediminum]|uniref:Cysteine hydrolase n=1 Tax=Verticiella sediminum TaxID=1247510 RepID=A0A556A9B2_9BURK|nr:cysteine hydrolase [Verticiella sediminum]TSH89460.1 cysteine hydrolase [Verticiella sediminum]